MLDVVTRILAAGPDFASGIKTRLRKFGGIKTEQLNSFCRATACRRPQQTNALLRTPGHR